MDKITATYAFFRRFEEKSGLIVKPGERLGGRMESGRAAQGSDGAEKEDWGSRILSPEFLAPQSER